MVQCDEFVGVASFGPRNLSLLLLELLEAFVLLNWTPSRSAQARSPLQTNMAQTTASIAASSKPELPFSQSSKRRSDYQQPRRAPESILRRHYPSALERQLTLGERSRNHTPSAPTEAYCSTRELRIGQLQTPSDGRAAERAAHAIVLHEEKAPQQAHRLSIRVQVPRRF